MIQLGNIKGKQTYMIFLNFSKAFNSVNHNILIDKLRTLGFKLFFP